MSKSFSKKILSTVIAASCLAEAAPVLAQGMLEEVVVSARKREETIMKVPVTVSVLSGETLDQYAIRDVKGIAEMTPGLNFNTGPLSSGVLVSLRGVGTGTNNPTIDQSVALVVDGMQLTQGLAFQAATFDMAQVEVMKGPQALFFGKAAPAGVIAIRSADPTDEAEARLRVGYEDEAEEKMGELILSGPVTDTLGLRLGAQFSDMEGYFRNESVPAENPAWGSLGAAPVTEKDSPNTETLLLRGTAVWNATDRLDARLKLNYADVDTQGFGGELQYASCPEGTDSYFGGIVGSVSQTPPVNFIGGTDCKFDDKYLASYMDPAEYLDIYNGGVPFMKFEQYFGSLELNYDLGNDLSLASVTGYYDIDQKSLVNGSATTIYGTPMGIQGHLERSDFTQELRLTSSYSGALNFMVGGFYQDGGTDYFSYLPTSAAYIDYVAVLGSEWPPALAKADHEVNTETVSLFGQILWNITPELELGVGARWTKEDRDHKVTDLMPTIFGGTAMQVPLGNSKIGDDNWSPEVSLSWTPTEELTVYGNLKQAFKSGSFDTAGAVAPGEDTSFGDERVRGGELGLKSLLWGGNLFFNTAGYYYKYKDLQVESNVFDPLAGVAGVRTNNAAEAEVYGVDADLSYAPPGIEGLTLSAAVNWNKAEYEEFDTALCWTGQTQSQGCNIDLDGNGIGNAQDLSGEPLLRAPEWTGNIGFDYQTPVFSDMTLRLGSTAIYSDEYSAGLENRSDMYQDSYTKVNASIALSGAEDRWRVELIGDNITDEITTGKCTVQGFADTVIFGGSERVAGTGTVNGGPAGKGEVGCHPERGRSVWMRFTYNFL